MALEQLDFALQPGKHKALVIGPGRRIEPLRAFTGEGNAIELIPAEHILRTGRELVSGQSAQKRIALHGWLIGKHSAGLHRQGAGLRKRMRRQHPQAKFVIAGLLCLSVQQVGGKAVQQAAQLRVARKQRALPAALLAQRLQYPQARKQAEGIQRAHVSTWIAEAALIAIIPAHAGRQKRAQIAGLGGGHHAHGARKKRDGALVALRIIGAAQRKHPQAVRQTGRGERSGYGGGKRGGIAA